MRTDRRTFIVRLSKGALGFAMAGSVLAACSDDAGSTSTSVPADGTTASPPSTATSIAPPTTVPPTTGAPATTPASTMATSGSTAWERILVGNVSAFVLVRNGEAAVIDTGNPGSGDDIEAGLASLGAGWEDVGHVILTHLHPDHVGSLDDVMAAAPEATGYAGAADIPGIASPRPLTAVGDGDSVFDLTIIETPGHTPGSISVLDSTVGLLLAGDALNGSGGGVVGPNPSFTADLQVAAASVAKLAGFDFETVVFGHGDPVVGDASAQVAALTADL